MPDVRRLAHRRRVAELLRGLLHRRGQQLAPVGDAVHRFLMQPREDVGADQGPRPGAEVLGGEPLSHHFLDVLVDHLPLDLHQLARVVPVLEELPAARVLQLAYDASDPAVVQLSHLALPRLPHVVEVHRVAVHRRVPVLQRGDAEAAVLLGVDLAARPHEAGGQDAEDAAQHPLAGQAGQSEGSIDLLAQARQGLPEGDELLVLPPLPLEHCLVAVAVLPAALLVPADRLQLRARRPAHRHVRPGRGDLELFQPGEVPLACSHPPETGLRRPGAVDAGLLKLLDQRHEGVNLGTAAGARRGARRAQPPAFRGIPMTPRE